MFKHKHNFKLVQKNSCAFFKIVHTVMRSIKSDESNLTFSFISFLPHPIWFTKFGEIFVRNWMKFRCPLWSLWCVTNSIGALKICSHALQNSSLIIFIVFNRFIYLYTLLLVFWQCTRIAEKSVSTCVENCQESYVAREKRISPQVVKLVAYYCTHACKAVLLN